MIIPETLNTADSVVIASHYSPNESVYDEKTGRRLPHFEVVKDGKLNESIVQERKRLNKKDIGELAGILAAPAVKDSIFTMCFQPRNGIFAYKSGKLSFIDICFDCHGFTASRDFGSALVLDDVKYKKLLGFYKKHGFKYMLD